MATALVTAPVLWTPLVGDDQINVLGPWINSAVGRSVFESAWDLTKIWVRDQGRFYPIAQIWGSLLFEATHTSIALYKLVLFVLVVGAVISFVVVVRVITDDAQLAMLAGVLVAPTFEFQWSFYDPVVAFTGLLPLTFILACGAVTLAWQSARSEGRNSPAIALGAAALAVASMLTYETMVPFLVIALVLLVVRYGVRSRPARWAALSLAIPLALEFVLVVVLLARRRAPIPAYTANLAAGPVTRTFLRQLSGALPLSQASFSSGWRTRFHAATDGIGTRNGAAIALTVICLGAVAVLAARALRSWTPTRRALATTALLGLTLLAGPGLLIAVTTRWQSELVAGVGYLSVFHQYFGLALVAASMIGLGVIAMGKRRRHLMTFTMLFLVCASWLAVSGFVALANWSYAIDQRDQRITQDIVLDGVPKLDGQLEPGDVLVITFGPSARLWKVAVRGATGIEDLSVVDSVAGCTPAHRCFEVVVDQERDRLDLHRVEPS